MKTVTSFIWTQNKCFQFVICQSDNSEGGKCYNWTQSEKSGFVLSQSVPRTFGPVDVSIDLRRNRMCFTACKRGRTRFALRTDELPFRGLGQRDAVQVEGSTALALAQQQLPRLLTHLRQQKHYPTMLVPGVARLTRLPPRSPFDFTSHRVRRHRSCLPDGSSRSGSWNMPTTNYAMALLRLRPLLLSTSICLMDLGGLHRGICRLPTIHTLCHTHWLCCYCVLICV